MIKKIDRYLLKSFFASLLVVTVSFTLIIIIINITEELRDFIDHEVTLLKIAEYYLYWSGWVIKSFLPMFILIATLFSVSMLARHKEILAMKASGLSLYRFALPYLVVVLLISAGHFYYNEYMFPPINKRRLEIKEYTIEKRSRASDAQVSNIHRQVSPGYFYTMNRFNATRMEGRDLKVYITENDRLKRLITASIILFRDHKWIARNGTERIFSPTSGESYREFEKLVIPEIQDKPKDLAKHIGKPEDMGIDELTAYIKLMKRIGGPYAREAVDLGIKYSYPLASFIVMLMSIPFASNPRRGGIAVSISVGALISLLYFIMFRILQSAGYNEKIPKELAVWGVNGFFFLVGIISMLNVRK
ncbi:MAG: LptF/LptG family permease [candidate division Zixibacteria bacterium]|nr:LptF/LptG family permease [candidate division Zixibacteria bacterium]